MKTNDLLKEEFRQMFSLSKETKIEFVESPSGELKAKIWPGYQDWLNCSSSPSSNKGVGDLHIYKYNREFECW